MLPPDCTGALRLSRQARRDPFEKGEADPLAWARDSDSLEVAIAVRIVEVAQNREGDDFAVRFADQVGGVGVVHHGAMLLGARTPNPAFEPLPSFDRHYGLEIAGGSGPQRQTDFHGAKIARVFFPAKRHCAGRLDCLYPAYSRPLGLLRGLMELGG